VGRKRKDPDQGLPLRVYLRRGTLYYAHRDGRWENLGKDLEAARRRAEHYADTTGTFGTMAWWLQQFVIDCEQRVQAKDLAERTLQDYRGAVGSAEEPTPLRTYFGHMLPTDIKPQHVSEYLELGAKMGRPTRANRERACLSSCISWLLRTGKVPGLQVNPCMQASGVQRNAEKPRELYVEHAWYTATYRQAPESVQLLMELTYRTLQRPESDIIRWTSTAVRVKDGAKVLSFRQYKTGRQVDIALTGRLAELVQQAVGSIPQLHRPLVHTVHHKAYTYSGISAMLKRAQAKARAADKALADMPSWGFRDLKGKGATDLWLAGEPIERIQLLCGHAKKTTTETYIKQRWRETAMPNALNLAM
jgi:integrase